MIKYLMENETLHLIVLVLHVLGAAVVIGSLFASVFVVFGKKISKERLELLDRLWKVIGPVIGIQAITGIYLAATHWDEVGNNPLFWAKMGVFLIEAVWGGIILNLQLRNNLSKKENEVSWPGVSAHIKLSFLFYIIIATLGVILAETV